MRLLPAVLLLLPHPGAAQTPPPLTRADSALVARVLLAENRRDSAAAVFRPALRHPDPRIALLARRALARIRDPRFAARDSLPPAAAAPFYPETAWRLRLRALTPKSGCAALEAAVTDSAWPVRLHAADLAAAACTGRSAILGTLVAWMHDLPDDAAERPAGGVSWHAAAHALEALARLAPDTARAALLHFASHAQWQVRRAAARTAATLADTAQLRMLAYDSDANVQEAAIEGLARLVGHEADDVYLAALSGTHAQAVRAAAVALKGSRRPEVADRALEAWRIWVRQDIASARDVRTALLDAAGRPASDDTPAAQSYDLPPDAVRLALGADVRLRVVMEPTSGGGSFVVRLRGDLAPIMAAEILALVERHYYDGLTWHRVEHDFVIQGGSPDANEYVGLDRYLRDELGTVAHPRGTVGMSTRGHDTGDGQWFVNLRDNARLRQDYTVFGEVTEGIEVVDGVLEGDRIGRIEVVAGR